MKLFEPKIVKDYIELYEKYWWTFIQKEWWLLDEYVFFWNNLKYTVLIEQYLNERSSCYKIRQFKKLPKKYEEYFDFYWY